MGAQVRSWLRLSRGIDTLMEWVGALSMMLVTLLLGVGIYNVVVRYIGRLVGRNLASNTLLEAQWYLFSIIFFLGSPLS
jgi:TRAP-type mannitol/chloroaromatic compound transport system permease small subunit